METIVTSNETIPESLLNPGTHQQAFSQLLKNHQQEIYFFIRRNVVQHEQTDELVQDVFVKFYHHVPTLKAGDNLCELLYTFAARACQHYFRRQLQSTWLPQLAFFLKQEESSFRDVAGMLALPLQEVRAAYYSFINQNKH